MSDSVRARRSCNSRAQTFTVGGDSEIRELGACGVQIGVGRDELAHRGHAEPRQNNQQQHRVTGTQGFGRRGQCLDRVDETALEGEWRCGSERRDRDADGCNGCAQACARDQGRVEPQQRFIQPKQVEQREVEQQHGGEAGKCLAWRSLPGVQPADDVDQFE
ncbi:MAG TPA: hypothetical protein VGK33_15970 [Chloroflexota bacterium]